MVLLRVRDLSVGYETTETEFLAVDDVTLDIPEGTIVGLVGESGCGKSTLARSLVRVLPENGFIDSGSIAYDGRELTDLSDEAYRQLRWDKLALMPQGAMGILDPVYSIQEQLIEPIRVHHPEVSKAECIDRAEEALETVGIDTERLHDYPHQLSGGMRQRILIAMSLILEPDLIIADEPTTGLDVLIRDKILNDIEQLSEEFGFSVLFISHDIADVVETSDHLLVMYGGKIVEQGPSREVMREPAHPYTIMLKALLPETHTRAETLRAVDMEPPNLLNPPAGCRFINKCPYAVDECETAHPGLEPVDHGGEAACYRRGEAAELREELLAVER